MQSDLSPASEQTTRGVKAPRVVCEHGSESPRWEQSSILPAAALNICRWRALRAAPTALSFESIFTAVDVALGPLLHFLNGVARLVHVLLAECADHKLDLGFIVGSRANVESRSQFLPVTCKTARIGGPSGVLAGDQLRWVTRALRDPEGFPLKRLCFFQDGLARALQAMAFSYGLFRLFDPGAVESVFSRPLR
ncbi:hypothetical protein [Microvirga sp. BSC39]|uniref:hypothetical protein n=1 Tax=Microvirga sp. BSC39 TaxID=1549810 RepID=UPI0012698BAC|nr:hypothetical protein [Microvirga sp. BSC39]